MGVSQVGPCDPDSLVAAVLIIPTSREALVDQVLYEMPGILCLQVRLVSLLCGI